MPTLYATISSEKSLTATCATIEECWRLMDRILSDPVEYFGQASKRFVFEINLPDRVASITVMQWTHAESCWRYKACKEVVNEMLKSNSVKALVLCGSHFIAWNNEYSYHRRDVRGFEFRAIPSVTNNFMGDIAYCEFEHEGKKMFLYGPDIIDLVSIHDVVDKLRNSEMIALKDVYVNATDQPYKPQQGTLEYALTQVCRMGLFATYTLSNYTIVKKVAEFPVSITQSKLTELVRELQLEPLKHCLIWQNYILTFPKGYVYIQSDLANNSLPIMALTYKPYKNITRLETFKLDRLCVVHEGEMCTVFYRYENGGILPYTNCKIVRRLGDKMVFADKNNLFMFDGKYIKTTRMFNIDDFENLNDTMEWRDVNDQ